jgi:uncharacterized protein CbrC (UPF0167 family)
MSDPHGYPYFAAPHAFSTYLPAPRRCDLCRAELPGYGGPFAGGLPDSPQVKHVCEGCLRSGMLESRGLHANSADQPALSAQLSTRFPSASSSWVEKLVTVRTAIVERRTPALVTWQPLMWPAHCGDYCRYLKEVGRPDLVLLAPDSDGRAFLARHAHGIVNASHAEELWEGIRPDAPADNAVAYATGVYLFQCRKCARPVILWDSD